MIQVKVTAEPLIVQTTFDLVHSDGAGGTCIFVGTVRNQTKGKQVLRLDFEAYVPMAEKEMRKIAATVTERWKAHHVVMHHRIGSLAIGEVPVIIAVATPHRKAAFEACQYAIDTLKETVPIWKKEFFEDGAVWVAAHP